MRIDYKNKDQINQIYVHDSIFEGFIYREEDKNLYINLKNYCINKIFKLLFCNVLIINCELCQFWGESPNILDWEVSENGSIIQNIKKKQKENNKLYSNSLVDLEKSYMEVKITFTSGDIIEIVCEYIEFEEDDL